MKKIILFVLSISSLVFGAEESQSVTEFKNVQNVPLAVGSLEVGGGLRFGYSSAYGTSSSLYPKAEYFFTENLSVGGSASIFVDSGFSAYGLGPSFSYYFWKKEKMAVFLGANLIYNRYSNDSIDWTEGMALGMKYFLTPSVSFGPELSYTVRNTDKSYTSYPSSNSSFDLQFHFSIFL